MPATAEKKASVAKPLRRGWKRLLFIFVFLPLLGVFLVAKFLVAPLVACRMARSLVSREINGHFEVDWASVGFREIELSGAKLFDDAGRQMGAADRVVVRFDRPLAGFGDPNVTEVSLVRPEIDLRREADGQWNLQHILSKPQPPERRIHVRTLEKVTASDGRLDILTEHFAFRFHALAASIAVEQNRFVVTKADGLAYGGRVALTGWAGTGENIDWSAQLNVQQADVSELARGTFAQEKKLSGRLDGFLALERTGREPKPVGAGWFDMRGGRLYQLPVLLAVFNILRFESPSEAAIDTAQSEFRVDPKGIDVDRVAIVSPVLSLCGAGRLDYEGEKVDLDFVPKAGRAGDEEIPPPDADPRVISEFISKNVLVTVEVRGTWRDPSADVVPLGVVTKPLRALLRLFSKEKK